MKRFLIEVPEKITGKIIKDMFFMQNCYVNISDVININIPSERT